MTDLELDYRALGQHELFWQSVAQKNQDLAQYDMEQVEEQQRQSQKYINRLRDELDQENT